MTENTNSELIVLDCESVESTFKSISKIYSIKPNDIEDFLISLDIEEYFREHDPSASDDNVLTALFEKEFNKTFRVLDYVFWFHLTRTFRNNYFRDGILPLHQTLEENIWPAFFKIFRGTKHLTRLKHMKKQGVDNDLYNMKTKREDLSGPYALLIYNKKFKGTDVKTEFLEIPEIIEDICKGYQNSYNESIQDTVKNSLVSCIVKFKSRRRLDRRCISAALFYLYKICHNEKLSTSCNTCFDGEGKLIPYEDIIKIEYLNMGRG